ncbi:phage head closure protein [Christensenellaceae bacterium 44-20]
MQYSDIIELVAIKPGISISGYPTESEIKKEAFADVKSVRRSEFYEALKQEMCLVIVFNVRCCDYGNEKYVDFEGRRYKVARAYTKDSEIMELNCSEVKT